MSEQAASQKRSGAALAYLGTVASIAGTLLITPALTRSLGVSGYGLYQLAIAYGGYLVLLNFGMRFIVAREVASSRSIGDPDELRSRLAVLRVGLLVPLALLAIGAAILAALAVPIFGRSVPAESRPEFMAMYWLVIATLAVGFLAELPIGIVTGFERFRVLYGWSLCRYLLRPLLIIACLSIGLGGPAVVAVDLVLSTVGLATMAVYVRRTLQIHIGIPQSWDWAFVRQSIGFGLALILGAISTIVTLSLDKVILGAMTSTSEVAIYSIALTMLTAFGTLTLAIGTLYIPQTIRLVSQGSDRATNTALIVRPGRLQFAVGGTLLGGFLVFGQDFIRFWVGAEFVGAFLPALILFIPNLLVNVESVAVAVLDAQMKRMVRSVVALIGAALNVILTIVFVHWLGYVGAALASAVALLLGEIVAMNVYYHLWLNIDVFALYRRICQRILPVIALCTLAFAGIRWALPSVGPWWLGVAIGYVLSAGIGIYWLGFTAAERSAFAMPLSRKHRATPTSTQGGQGINDSD